jgi:hypothetical protein
MQSMAPAAPIRTDRTLSQSTAEDAQCNEPQASATKSVENAGNMTTSCMPLNETSFHCIDFHETSKLLKLSCTSSATTKF